MAITSSPAGVTEQELKTGLSLMGEGSRRGKINAMMLGFGCMIDDSGQVVVTRVLQESPAAYSGQVGIGDVIDAIDGRMVTSLQLLADMADGPVRISNAFLSSTRVLVFLNPLLLFSPWYHCSPCSLPLAAANVFRGLQIVCRRILW